MLRVRLLDPVSTEASFVVQARDARAARRSRSPCRSCACRRRSARAAASPSTWSAPARSPSRQARGLEPADPSELGEIVAGRESPSMIAFRLRPMAGTEPRSLDGHGRALHAAGGARRQRRRGALPRAGCRRRPAAGRGALCGPQQPAKLPEGDAAAGLDGVERGGRAAGRFGRAWRSRTPCCCRSRKAAPARMRRPSSSSSSTCSAIESWVDKGTARDRAAGARSADLAHGPRAVLLAALPRRARSPATFRLETAIPVRSPRRCAVAAHRRRPSRRLRAPRTMRAAPDSRRWSIVPKRDRRADGRRHASGAT